jgi:hypothetical protein
VGITGLIGLKHIVIIVITIIIKIMAALKPDFIYLYSSYLLLLLVLAKPAIIAAGISHTRLTACPNVPAKNHTGPFCFCAQFLPVSSYAGLIFFGIE